MSFRASLRAAGSAEAKRASMVKRPRVPEIPGHEPCSAFRASPDRIQRPSPGHAGSVLGLRELSLELGAMHTHTPLATALLVSATLLVRSTSASGQTPPTNEELLRRIEAMEVEIADLRTALNARLSKPTTTVPAMNTPEPPTTQEDRTFLDNLHDLQFGATLDTYYEYNFNRPIGRVNLLRAYDITSNNFSLNQASVVIERAPDLAAGRRFGARVDLQYGQATETLQGSLANEPRPWVYRKIFQAYGTYVAPVGAGLTIDFGKWASALGYENNYTKDQLNYSRSYWFNFLPFYHMGARVNYRFNDRVALNYWITNGTQQTEAFNNFKDQLVGLSLQPSKAVSWTVNYYLGQEHPDVQTVQNPALPALPTQSGLSITPVVPYFTGKLQLFDSYATWQASAANTFAIEADYVTSQNPTPAAASWVSGGAAYARHQLTTKTAIAARGEYLVDHGGLFTGRSQRLTEATITYDYQLNDGFLVRSEWRRDFSDTPFFLTNASGRLNASQTTATLGVIWWWGTKRGAW
jgi:hypothetical protein